MAISCASLAGQTASDLSYVSDSEAFINFMNSQVKSQILFKSNNNEQIRMGLGIGPTPGCRPRTVCTTDSDCDGGKCEVHSHFPPPDGPRHCVCY